MSEVKLESTFLEKAGELLSPWDDEVIEKPVDLSEQNPEMRNPESVTRQEEAPEIETEPVLEQEIVIAEIQGEEETLSAVKNDPIEEKSLEPVNNEVNRSEEEETKVNQETQANPDTLRSSKSEVDSGIPGELIKLVYHPKDSLVYNILSRKPIQPMTEAVKSSIMADLNNYTNLCIQRGLISEAGYVQNLFKNIRTFKTVPYSSVSMKKLQENIEHTESEIEAQRSFWDNQKAILESDLTVNRREMEADLCHHQSLLDQEWQNPKKQAKYSKPSGQLLQLRYMAQRMIHAKQLDGVAQVGKKILLLQDNEAANAAERMNSDYIQADLNLRRQYEADLTALESRYRMNLDALAVSSDKNMSSAICRLNKLKIQREQMIKAGKVIESSPFQNLKSISPLDNDPFKDIGDVPKLNIPTLKPIQRNKRQSPLHKSGSDIVSKNISSKTSKAPSRTESRVSFD